ncbi:hypothetical protein LVK10_11355 [Tenacibaculum maritimum]|uniref:hypothetical protein n=4 Tax=Tenacibaculum maritimum TaxID=107401 RepID=UPI001E2D600A|nr:hypothetical protein [Tenacibaculum maritimum]MCD9563100.1 hypothetical protein [Tenacibaculum maritimum]MCD9579907.1 hypothetical protein [Tenacibaculum maritimum]MCD9597286.1 hypothetical protein [Tenacibaculum maritimum]MCD9614488.1 hypothetical protein [Tenacibaculum maritimum]
MHKIITINDLINYLKIPDFSEKVNQEIITVKITRTALFQKETILLKDFPRTNKELSIPQTLFIDTDNVAYNKHILHGNTYYKRISYNKDPRVFTDANFQEPLVSVNIPNHLYNEGIRFYINPNHQLIGFIAVAHVDNSKDYINFNPDNFSVFNENTYHYSNVYGTKTLEKLKIVTASSNASAHRFPILSKQLGDSNPYQLSYYYKKDTHKMLASFALDENEKPMIALKIGFKTLSGVLSFLKETIFNYYNEVNDFRSKWRHRFLERIGYHITPVANTSNLKNKKALIYQIPEALYYVFYNNSSLWAAVQILASGTITNILGTNEEDLLLKLLKIIYHRHTHKYNKVQDVGRKVVDEKEAPTSKRLNDIYLNKLLTIKADNKILLQKLTDDLDGEQFKTYIYFIWSIWKNSSYANINPETNKTIKITGESPVLLDYRSDKTLGIHYNNATINWEANTFRIDLDIRIKTGTKKVPKLVNIAYETPKPQYIDTGQTTEVAIYQTFQYGYHPFSPTVLLNSKNPTFLLKDKDQKEGIRFTKLPAFLLYANNQKAFWENVLTGVEYSVDILTTVSGVGNLIKAGRLVKLLKNGKTLLYKTKQVTTAIATTKAIAGVIEVSSGTVNALLKLTSIDDTKLGISISKYLFYLEMIALTGEVSVFLKGKLQQSAKEIVENPKFTKSLDELVKKGNISELEEFNFYREILKASRQYSDDLKILGIVPKLTNATEKAFLKKLKVIFYKKYKVYLLKLNEEIVIAEKWKQTTNSKPLIKSEIDELLSLRKLKKSAFNKNTAIMEVDLLIKNEELTLKYKAIAGKGQSAEDLVKSANQEDLIRQLELSDKNDLMSHFKAIDKQTGELKNRFQDSEVKMLDTFDEHLSKFHVKYGEENIKIINMRLKTLYEPCMSCKKQFIIRQEIYGINKIDIKATWNIKEEKFVQGNKDLQELSLIK